MDKEFDQHRQAALWLAEQLVRPVDPEAEDTVVHSQQEISKEFKDLDLADVESWDEQFRILTWTETSRRGKKISMELVETTRLTYKLRAEMIPQISLGEATFSVIDTSCSRTRHTILIVAVDKESEEEKVLSYITINRILKENELPLLGFESDNLDLALKAWVHLGGSLEELEGVPSYLDEE